MFPRIRFKHFTRQYHCFVSQLTEKCLGNDLPRLKSQIFSGPLPECIVHWSSVLIKQGFHKHGKDSKHDNGHKEVIDFRGQILPG